MTYDLANKLHNTPATQQEEKVEKATITAVRRNVSTIDGKNLKSRNRITGGNQKL